MIGIGGSSLRTADYAFGFNPPYNPLLATSNLRSDCVGAPLMLQPLPNAYVRFGQDTEC